MLLLSPSSQLPTWIPHLWSLHSAPSAFVKHHHHLTRGLSDTHTAPANICSPPDEAHGTFYLLRTKFPVVRAELKLQTPQKAAGPLCCVHLCLGVVGTETGVGCGAKELQLCTELILWGLIPGDSTWVFPWHSLCKGCCHQSKNARWYPQMKDRRAPKAQTYLSILSW